MGINKNSGQNDQWKEYTLWRLLKEYKVEIPVIQRDYAQGREDNSHIRKNFLVELKQKLDEDDEKAPLKLDFVYGVSAKCTDTGSRRFDPLDGQQRLTTLWLLHWFLAFKSGKLKNKRSNKIKRKLKKLSYETRTSSREFCECLCDKMVGVDSSTIDNIADYIRDQSWFYAEWIQDSTINGMLRTLSGDGASDEKDNIEAVFKVKDIEDYDTLFDKLTGQERIVFNTYFIEESEVGIPDDLYIKMNARGKSTSDFDNLKTDILKNIDNKEGVRDDISKSFDTTWTNLFWQYAIETKGEDFDGEYDEAIFHFINRYVVNKIICSKKENDENDEKDYNELIGKKLEYDTLVRYKDYDVYKRHIDTEDIKTLNRIIINFINYNKVIKNENNDNNEEIWDWKKLTEAYKYFLPYYCNHEDNVNNNNSSDKIKNEVRSITYKERVYFKAICDFMSLPEDDYKDQLQYFDTWMRVAGNLIMNPGIDSESAMKARVRDIGELWKKIKEELRKKKEDENSVWTNSVWIGYEVLSKEDIYDKKFAKEEQYKEEIEKAKIIMAASEAGQEAWEDRFITAEQHSFFSGSIRFLYRNEDGGLYKKDDDSLDLEKIGELFDKKLKAAQKAFSSDKTAKIALYYVKMFLNYFSSFDEIKDKYLFTTLGSDPRKGCWKDILCDPSLANQVHYFLLDIYKTCTDANDADDSADQNNNLKNNPKNDPKNNPKNKTKDEDYEEFIKCKKLLKKLADPPKAKSEDFKYMYRYYQQYETNAWAIYEKKSRDKKDGVLIKRGRSEKTAREENEYMSQKEYLADDDDYNGFLWGMDIPLKKGEKNYIWHADNSITDENNENADAEFKSTSEATTGDSATSDK